MRFRGWHGLPKTTWLAKHSGNPGLGPLHSRGACVPFRAGALCIFGHRITLLTELPPGSAQPFLLTGSSSGQPSPFSASSLPHLCPLLPPGRAHIGKGRPRAQGGLALL